MKKILIIGGGFAGLSAAGRLCKSGLGLDVNLIDKKEENDFLPLLPDVVGRGIRPEFLGYELKNASRHLGFKFINEEVISISLEKREVSTRAGKLIYDYLIVASGSETNFYGNDNIKKYAYKLDDINDGRKIIRALKEEAFNNFIIGGAGYTGIELATNLRLFLERNKKPGKIVIVERQESILGPLPLWMKDYVLGNLKRLNIDILTNSTIEHIEEGNVSVSGKRIFNQAMVVWAAGVKTADFIRDLNVEKNPQGRIKVDDYLRLDENCFVVGDAAYFSYKNSYLRMAVQFAIAQGNCAAGNIINSIKVRQLHRYKPIDFGYIIPMANNKSCGKIIGLSLKGYAPTVFHYIMCFYRSYGVRNKFGILNNLK